MEERIDGKFANRAAYDLVALLIILRISGYKISAWAYAAVLIATLLNSFFSVWRDAYRSYRAEPFELLAQECSSILKFVSTMKNPDPKQEFYLEAIS